MFATYVETIGGRWGDALSMRASDSGTRVLPPQRQRVEEAQRRRRREGQREEAPEQVAVEEVIDLVGKGLLRPVIDRVFPLDEISDAQHYLEGRKAFGKVVLRIS